MNILIHRDIFTPDRTLGIWYTDGIFDGYTLEDTVREVKGLPVQNWKIPKVTAIPRGIYPVELTYSPHFKRVLPLLGRVPGYSGVRIHTGTTEADTEGCIIVGHGRLKDRVRGSRFAFKRLFDKMTQAVARQEPITLTIE